MIQKGSFVLHSINTKSILRVLRLGKCRQTDEDVAECHYLFEIYPDRVFPFDELIEENYLYGLEEIEETA